ncbi:MAG: response regulator [Asticcacaulis sp.]|nr:response regulator [Asticcacaulis sp.]
MTTHHAHMMRLLGKIDCARVAVLVVEDNDASRRLVIELLRATGFENVNFARDAEDAIAQMQGHNPDILLLDWNLPGISGLDLVRHIRAAAHKDDPRFSNPDIPIVMLTARQRARDVTAARNAGVNAFVVKPFSTTALLRAVCGSLTRKRRFVASQAYTGPDRRRRRAETYPGLLQRAEDQIILAPPQLTKASSIALDGLRDSLKSGGRVAARDVERKVRDMVAAERKTQELRLDLMERAAQSLNAYIGLFGREADAEVVDVHLDALIRLNEVPYGQEALANGIVRHLDTLVAKRTEGRKSLA